MSVSALIVVLALAGASTIVLSAAGVVPQESVWFGFVALLAAAMLHVGERLERVVERVVCREVSALLAREIAAYHLGRSRGGS